MSKTIKVAFKPLHDALTALHVANPNATLNQVLQNPDILSLMEAKKGGFTGESNFIEIDGLKVARTCAMTGAIFPHTNTDKALSFFYKNGSYMIGAEIVKANARKAWELERNTTEQDLEDQMLEGTITPKEWKAEVQTLKADEFNFVLDDATKAQLIADFDGYETKEDFITAYTASEVNPFTDYTAETNALRALAPKAEEAEEPTPEPEAETVEA